MYVLALLVGCQDYQLQGAKLDPGPEDTGGAFDPGLDTASAETPEVYDGEGELEIEEPSGEEAQASFHVVFQWGAFGRTVGRCQFEAAFYALEEDDGLGDEPSGQQMNMPEEAGTCAFTDYDPDEAGEPGDMSIRGTLDAGPSLRVYDEGWEIELTSSVDGDGNIRYNWTECERETFPFGRTLGISGPGVSGGIGAFDLDDLIVVGPDHVVLEPAEEDLDSEILPHSLSEPFVWSWDWATPLPVSPEGEVTPDLMFVLRNARRSDNALLESLACMPEEDGIVVVDPEDLAQLTPDPGDGSTYGSAQLDATFEGASVETPWGQTGRVRSMISMSGLLRLSE